MILSNSTVRSAWKTFHCRQLRKMSTAATGLPWWKLKSSAHHAMLSHIASNAVTMQIRCQRKMLPSVDRPTRDGQMSNTVIKCFIAHWLISNDPRLIDCDSMTNSSLTVIHWFTAHQLWFNAQQLIDCDPMINSSSTVIQWYQLIDRDSMINRSSTVIQWWTAHRLWSND